MHSRRISSLVCAIMTAWCSAEAQIGVGDLLSATSERVTSTNYYYARPNDLTIIVNVVGFVQRPGRYEIASTIDLVNLISLAGGPTSDGALDKVTVTRIINGNDNPRRTVMKVDLEDMVSIKPDDLMLAPGDVVAVDKTAWSGFRDGFSVVVSGAIIATAISQVIIATR